jgi:D-3-phosphoglycerate dehydrogenase
VNLFPFQQRPNEIPMKAIFLDCNDQLAPVWERVVRADDPPIDVNRRTFARDELPRIIRGYDIAIDDHSYMPTPLVAQCPELKHIVFLGTGPASYMNVGELNERGIKVHIIKGYGDTAVAEHTIALMWACARNIARMDREVRRGVWTPHEGVQLLGKTLGVIGLGGIGREVARIGKGMGMNVIGWNRTKRPEVEVPLVDIDTLLARADIVSMNLTLGDETRGFLSAERIARMKKGAIYVNTARGALADETALIEALQSGHIRHAGLDVFHNEPLSPDHALAKLENVTLSAHAAFRTPEASETLLRRAIDIVKAIS